MTAFVFNLNGGIRGFENGQVISFYSFLINDERSE